MILAAVNQMKELLSAVNGHFSYEMYLNCFFSLFFKIVYSEYYSLCYTLHRNLLSFFSLQLHCLFFYSQFSLKLVQSWRLKLISCVSWLLSWLSWSQRKKKNLCVLWPCSVLNNPWLLAVIFSPVFGFFKHWFCASRASCTLKICCPKYALFDFILPAQLSQTLWVWCL